MRCLPRCAAVLLIACCFNLSLAATGVWQGRPVTELLESLNSQGYQIIFSSDVVTDDLLVAREPDLSAPLRSLRTVLATHQLKLEHGPANTWLVRKTSQPALVDDTAARAKPVALPEVVVTSSLHRIEYAKTETNTYLDRDLAARIPAAGEEAVRITARLPGTAGGGISTRNHVRGGEANEVLFLLDGLRLYEPFHLKDFQSVATIVNPNAIDGIDFYTGAYPARYGDRMSGVMNMRLREPTKAVETELSLSFFNTSAVSMGTFGDDGQGDWLFAARRGNLDLIADVIDPDVGSPNYQDYLLHGGWEFGPRTQFSANLLVSVDKLTLADVDRGESANASYENRVLWFKWNADWSANLRSETLFSVSDISNRRIGVLILPQIVSGSLDESRAFNALSLKQDWTYVLSEKWMLSFGAQSRQQDASYRFSSTRTIASPFDGILDNESVTIRNFDLRPEGAQYGAYVEARWQLRQDLIVDAGLRWDYQNYTTVASDRQTSPRLSVLYRLNERTELRLGWGQFSQAQEINELQASDGVDSFFPAQRAEHIVANLKYQLGKKIEVDLSYYRKSFRAVRPRFENAFNTLTFLPELQFDRYRIDPISAEASGAELMVFAGDSSEQLFWWLGYAWSEVRDNTLERKIARSWDQTHTVKAGVSWRWRRWDLSAAGEVHTGWPKSVLISESVTNPDGTVSLAVVASEPNSLRYSVFHTLDVRISREFVVRRGDLTVFLEASNLYNRANPCCTEYSVTPSVSAATLLAKEDSWLPLVPSLGVVWRF